MATHLRGLLGNDPAFSAPTVTELAIDTASLGNNLSLMSFFYYPGGRAERLSHFAQPWSHVVLLESSRIGPSFPEIYFEGVRVLGCAARAAGAKPIVLMPWSSTTDMAKVSELTYRVGNGTGAIVVPAGQAWEAVRAEDASTIDASVGDAGAHAPVVEDAPDPFVAAATLYSALTGRNAGVTGYQPTGIASERATKLATVAFDTVGSEAAKVHYQAAYAGPVELRTASPGGDFWFMASGSSSEQIWVDRMNELLPKSGRTAHGTHIGYTNPGKVFDSASLDAAGPYFASHPYEVLLARAYDVDASTITARAGQPDLQVQIWDRHYDSDSSEGTPTVGNTENALKVILMQAAGGYALLPYHLMFAKLKTMRPAVQLLTDGVHATYPVGYGLAAMSFVSRTGEHPSLAGLDADTQLAVQLADATIRQLATLSATGKFVPDDPASRPAP